MKAGVEQGKEEGVSSAGPSTDCEDWRSGKWTFAPCGGKEDDLLS